MKTLGAPRPAVSRALVLLLAAGATCLGAAEAPEAMALLAKAAAAFSSGAADESPFTQTYTPAGFAATKRESGTVWVQAPDKLRFDYAAPDTKVFTYDAGEGRFFSPEDKQLNVHKLSPDEKARLPLIFLEKPDELARRYEISRDAAGAVVLKPRAAASELAWLKLAIGDSGMVETLAWEDTSGNRTEFHFAEWKTVKARPPADYRVTGPKGTRIVEN